nr:hypothetical protein [uncultured Oscillibacter sp.]
MGDALLLQDWQGIGPELDPSTHTHCQCLGDPMISLHMSSTAGKAVSAG